MLDGKKYPDFVSPFLEQDQSLRSIAYPPISTGIFGAPADKVVPIGIKTVKEFIEKNPDALEEVHFVSSDLQVLPIYQTAIETLFPENAEQSKS
jgi:O-acetyl-ADP-ribose deacetylase